MALEALGHVLLPTQAEAVPVHPVRALDVAALHPQPLADTRKREKTTWDAVARLSLRELKPVSRPPDRIGLEVFGIFFNETNQELWVYHAFKSCGPNRQL